MDVTYEWSELWTQILYHPICHELSNGLLSKLAIPLHFVIITSSL